MRAVGDNSESMVCLLQDDRGEDINVTEDSHIGFAALIIPFDDACALWILLVKVIISSHLITHTTIITFGFLNRF